MDDPEGFEEKNPIRCPKTAGYLNKDPITTWTIPKVSKKRTRYDIRFSKASKREPDTTSGLTSTTLEST